MSNTPYSTNVFNFTIINSNSEKTLKLFSHELPLGTIKNNLQKVSMTPPKYVSLEDETYPKFQKGNIVIVRNAEGKNIFGYVLKYKNTGAVVKFSNGAIYRVPLSQISKTFTNYEAFCKKLHKTAGSNDFHVSKMQEIFDILPQEEKSENMKPQSSEFYKNSAPNWPSNSGFIEGSEKPLTPKSKVFVRVGKSDGSNFTNKNRTNDKTSLPYVENPAARKQFQFNDWLYREKINAIKNGDLSELNCILEKQKQKTLTDKEFEEIKKEYGRFESHLNKPFPSSIYGIKGEAAPWKDNKQETLLNGGATQFTTPLAGNSLKRLGIIFDKTKKENSK